MPLLELLEQIATELAAVQLVSYVVAVMAELATVAEAVAVVGADLVAEAFSGFAAATPVENSVEVQLPDQPVVVATIAAAPAFSVALPMVPELERAFYFESGRQGH